MATYASECPKLPWMINFFSTDEGRVPKHQLQAVYNDNRTDYLTKLNFESEPPRKRLTKIICTLGPKSFNVTEIERMVFAGMDIVRIKLPFFTLPECETTILNVRQACTNYSSKIGSVFRVAIALDLRGPEIRTGAFKDVGVQRITFEEGEETFLTADPAYQEHVTKEMIYVDYQAFNTLEPGDKIKINNSVHLSAVQEDTNVLIMDWTKGARGPQYAAAAANTEIAGRQLGLLLMSMFERGLEPLKTHLIGFSLGAHVAGCASEMTKSAGNLIGRITGLDPAGPLFRHNHLKEKTKKLDRSDAHFVDILHTDSSPVFIDGFGLWEPIGHADYYANGGQQQPGCQDLRASIVQTTFDRTLNKDNACSHLRAYYLYLESLMNKVSGRSCEFIAYKCPGGLPAFETGQCFPQIEDKTINPLALDIKYYTDIGKMGISSSGDGVMYFTTRNSAYFCGTQLQAHLALNEKTPNTKGIVNIQVVYANSTADFEIEADLEKPSNSFYALSAAEYSQTPPKSVTVHFNYRNYELRDQNNVTIPLGYYVILDKFELRNIHAQSWNYCQKAIQISRKTVSLKLHLDNTC